MGENLLMMNENHRDSPFLEVMHDVDNGCQKPSTEEEILSMHKNNTWNLVETPHGEKPIDCNWTNIIKINTGGKVEK